MKAKISVYQLFAGIVMAPLGTAILFLITPEAKQDAWIAMLIYIIPGIMLQIIYTSLWKKYPKDTIVTYMPKIFGKILGYIISIVYILLFAYEAARVARDFTDLILIASMPKVPSIIILLSIMLVSGYTAYLGLENMFRSVNVFLYLWIIFFILEWLFLYRTEGALKFYNIKPILHNGIVPVIKESWKLITFPYGETLIMAMFFPYVKEASKIRKFSILSIIFIGIFLALNTVMFISVLGVNFASNSLFPFLRTVRLIHIGETFDRIDIFIILIMMIGGFIKVSFFMYGSMLGFSQIVKIKDTKYLSLPFSVVIFFTAMLIAKNYPQHIYIGQTLTITYIHLPLTVIIPIIALIIYYIKRLIFKIDAET